MPGGQLASVGQGTVTAVVARPGMFMFQGVVTPSGNDVTVNITGEEAESFQGTLTHGFGLSGQAGAGAQGVFGLTRDHALIGHALTMSQGFVGITQDADDTFAQTTPGSIAGVEFGIVPTGVEATPAQGTITASNVQLLGEMAIAHTYHVFPEMERALVGLQMTSTQGDLLSEGGTPFEEVVTGVGAAGRRRYAYDFAIKVRERHYRFTDVDALVEFLSKEEKETEEKARAKAARDAKRIVRLGPAKASPEPPKLQMASAMPEIVEYIAEVKKKIDRAYWAALQEHLGVEAEELEDIKFLASIDL